MPVLLSSICPMPWKLPNSENAAEIICCILVKSMPLREIYSAASVLDAQILCDMLTEAGFSAVVTGGYLTGAVGEIPPDSYVKVLIDCENDEGGSGGDDLVSRSLNQDDQWARARLIVEEFESRMLGRAYPRTCQQCGEESSTAFTHCWSCQTEFEQD